MNRGVRILLIDDDRSTTTLLRRILAREGHKVELVQDLPGPARPGIAPPIASRQADATHRPSILLPSWCRTTSSPTYP